MPQARRILTNKLGEVKSNEDAVANAKHNEVEVEQDVAAVEKQIKELQKIGRFPERIVHKLAGLKFRLQVAKDTQVTQLRIANSRREGLDRWLSEGNPTNADLIEADRALSAIALRA